jgi:hypothetical protein
MVQALDLQILKLGTEQAYPGVYSLCIIFFMTCVWAQ